MATAAVDITALCGGAVELSPGLRTAWETALGLASAADAMLGSEHVLLALVSVPSTARLWTTTLGLSPEHIVDACKAVPGGSAAAVAMSPRLTTILMTARHILTREDTPTVLLNSEALLVSMVLSAVDGAAAGIILQQEMSRVGLSLDPAALLASVLPSGVSPDSLIAKVDQLRVAGREDLDWYTFVYRSPAAGDAAPPAAVTTLPALPDAASGRVTMKGPVAGTNWVVPGLVACGPRPGAHGSDDKAVTTGLLDAGITVFCSLEQEFEPVRYQRMYPKHIANWVARQPGPRVVTHTKFGIPDFWYADADAMLALGQHLAGLVRRGEKLYIHCHGGHGRTGMVIINLVQALYDGVSMEAARALVIAYHHARPCSCTHMPETMDQRAELVKMERANKREAHKHK